MFPDELADSLAKALRERQHRIVFAESCTAGLISASMARIAGVSDVLVGSAVVYQIETKAGWLNLAHSSIDKHGVVSEEVSHHMAAGALKTSPHASISASVTGHLGPNAPAELDGIAWTSVGCRVGDAVHFASRRLSLQVGEEEELSGIAIRRQRQSLAVREVMSFTLECLQNPDMLRLA